MEKQIRDENRVLKTVIDAVQDLVFFKNIRGEFVGCNAAFAEFFGIPEESFIGKTDADFFPPDDAAAFMRDDQETMRSGQPRTICEWAPAADGQRLYIETIKTPLYDADGRCIGIAGVSRDITERWHAAETLKRREAILGALVEAARLFLDSQAFSETVPEVLRCIGEAISLDRVTLFKHALSTSGPRRLSPAYRWPLPVGDLAKTINDSTWAELGLSRWEQELSQGREVYGVVSEMPPMEQRILSKLGICSIAALPIFVNSHWWGLLTVADTQADRRWSRTEIDTLSLAAAIIAAAIMRDRATRAAFAAKREAETAYRAKNLFLANLGHEVRTPMHGILSYARFGVKRAETVPREKLHTYFETILASGERLLDLLNDLLDLSKYDAGRADFEQSEHDLMNIINTIASEVSPRLDEHRMTLNVLPASTAPLSTCDERGVGQILRNLINNAIHYSPDGTAVTISIEAHVDGNGRSMLAVSVSDQGVGVAESEREAIFGEFFQSANTSSHTKGTGLGLSICRRITHRHGGRIWVAPRTDGPGSVFTFTLPPSVKPAESQKELYHDVAPAGSCSR